MNFYEKAMLQVDSSRNSNSSSQNKCEEDEDYLSSIKNLLIKEPLQKSINKSFNYFSLTINILILLH